MSGRIAIQATFVGYTGQPCTLFSAYDQNRRILLVAKEAKYRTDKFENCIVLSNDSAVSWDRFFSDEDLMPAINAFYSLRNGVADDGVTSRLAFSDKAQRSNPDGSIDRDGMDLSGPRYRVSDNVTCVQMAALATCLYAFQADSVERSVTMAQRMANLLCGDVLTI